MIAIFWGLIKITYLVYLGKLAFEKTPRQIAETKTLMGRTLNKPGRDIALILLAPAMAGSFLFRTARTAFVKALFWQGKEDCDLAEDCDLNEADS